MKTNKIYWFLFGLVFIVGSVFALTRDLSREAKIISAIAAHKIQKQAFSDNVEDILSRIAVPMIIEARRLESQANAIRAKVDAYLKDTGVTETQAEPYLKLVENKVDLASLERKANSLSFFKAVCLIISQDISDVEITDPNITGI